jgi:hypothetical protein
MPQLKGQRKLQEKHTYGSRKLKGKREGLKQVLPIKVSRRVKKERV